MLEQREQEAAVNYPWIQKGFVTVPAQGVPQGSLVDTLNNGDTNYGGVREHVVGWICTRCWVHNGGKQALTLAFEEEHADCVPSGPRFP